MARTSSIYDHFDLYLTPVTLTFNLPIKMFQMASSSRATTVPHYFKIHALLYKLWSGQIGTGTGTYTEQKFFNYVSLTSKRAQQKHSAHFPAIPYPAQEVGGPWLQMTGAL